MLRLIKAEIENRKIMWIGLYSIFITTFIAFLIMGLDVPQKSFPALRIIMIMAAGIIFLLRVLRISKEKTDRLQMQLPLTVSQVSLARVIVPNFFWLNMVILVSIAILILRPEILSGTVLYNWIAINGFVFAANAVPLIHRDLTFIFIGKWKKYILQFFFAIFVFAGYLLFLLFIVQQPLYFINKLTSPVQGLFAFITNTIQGALLFLLAGILLLVVSFFLFSHRKSYVE